MSGNHCHARGTPDRIVLDGPPSTALVKPGNQTLPSAFLTGSTDILLPLHHKGSEPVDHRTPTSGAPR